MTKGIFITATGTDIGKTFISGLLVKKMREFEFNCGYYKPALSGGRGKWGFSLFKNLPSSLRGGAIFPFTTPRRGNPIENISTNELIPGDAERVLEQAGISRNPSEVVSYIYEEAVSPHLAAERTGDLIYFDKIKEDFDQIKKDYDYIVVEGCGGIVCPLNLTDKKLMLKDVIKGLDLDVIIVADGGLGTINSAILTVEYAKANGINVKGIILNNFDKDNFMHQDNLKQIENLTGVKVIATVKKNAKELNIEKDILPQLFKEI